MVAVVHQLQGIGGSQESLMAVAAALGRLGHAVRVYNSCGSAAGEYEGVVYEITGRLAPNRPRTWWWLALAVVGVPCRRHSELFLDEDMMEPEAVIANERRFRKIFI